MIAGARGERYRLGLLGRGPGNPSEVMETFCILNEMAVIWDVHICQSSENCTFKMGNFI